MKQLYLNYVEYLTKKNGSSRIFSPIGETGYKKLSGLPKEVFDLGFERQQDSVELLFSPHLYPEFRNKENKTNIEGVLNSGLDSVILGEDGSGKGTLLYNIAVSALEKEKNGECIPVLLSLREVYTSKSSIAELMVKELNESGLLGNSTLDSLRGKKLLVLIDGIEEATSKGILGIEREIYTLKDGFSSWRFILSCQESSFDWQVFKGFRKLCIAKLQDEEVKALAGVYCKEAGGKKFTSSIENSDSLQELSRTPLNLEIMCMLYCGGSELPRKSEDLLLQGLQSALQKTSKSTNPCYKNLSGKRKEEFLQYIAYSLFLENKVFMQRDEAEQKTGDFLSKFLQQKKENQARNSKDVLRAISEESGILIRGNHREYSFSHRIFQDLLAARYIIGNALSGEVKTLISSVKDARYGRLFRFVAYLLPNADVFLLETKKEVCKIVSDSKSLQRLLVWAEEKAKGAKAPYPPASIRAFYLELQLNRGHVSILGSLKRELSTPLGLEHGVDIDLTHEFNVSKSSKFLIMLNFDRDLANCLKLIDLHTKHDVGLEGGINKFIKNKLEIGVNVAMRLSDFDLVSELYRLRKSLPDNEASNEKWLEFRKEFNIIASEYRNMGTDFGITDAEYAILEKYINANKILADCMNTECLLSQDTKDNILNTLLLPVK